MNKLKKKGLPEKRALTVDEIISKYPMSVRILLVQLVEQVERLEKKKPEIRIRPRFSKRTEVTEEWIEEKAKRLYEIVQLVGSSARQWIEHDKDEYIHDFKDFIRSLVEEVVKK